MVESRERADREVSGIITCGMDAYLVFIELHRVGPRFLNPSTDSASFPLSSNGAF